MQRELYVVLRGSDMLCCCVVPWETAQISNFGLGLCVFRYVVCGYMCVQVWVSWLFSSLFLYFVKQPHVKLFIAALYKHSVLFTYRHVRHFLSLLDKLLWTETKVLEIREGG